MVEKKLVEEFNCKDSAGRIYRIQKIQRLAGGNVDGRVERAHAGYEYRIAGGDWLASAELDESSFDLKDGTVIRRI